MFAVFCFHSQARLNVAPLAVARWSVATLGNRCRNSVNM